MNAMAAANRRANEKKKQQQQQAEDPSGSMPRKQNYSLFLKQRAVLFSAKKWKQWNLGVSTTRYRHSSSIHIIFRFIYGFVEYCVAKSPQIVRLFTTPAHPRFINSLNVYIYVDLKLFP